MSKPDPFRILVTGSRTWVSREAVWGALKQACDENGVDRVVIVRGACPRGADARAAQYAEMWNVASEPHPARWNDFGKAAGFRRNAEMVALGAGVCLAFIRDGSPGATHCAGLAEKAGIPVRRFEQHG